MKNILQKLLARHSTRVAIGEGGNNKKYLSILIGVFVVVLAVIVARPALAETVGFIASGLTSLLSWLFVAFINVVGNLLLKAIDILIKIANYGDFLNAPIVEKGWVVIRDLGNIALVFAVLAMAFATIFKRGAYQFSSIMVKILVAALLINFSKFLTGLAISVSQVFMMEFVRAFQTAAAGNLTYGFGIHDLLAFRETATGGAFGASSTGLDVNEWSILGAVVLGALMVGVAFVIVLSMAIMLMVRILVLWFLVMFSPIAFLATVLPPQLSGYSSMWRKELVKWLIAGPMVAFMLWLSLAVISEMTEEKRIINLSLQSAASKGTAQNSSDWTAFANKVSGTQNMVDYLVTAGLMMAALVIASKTSVAGASFANNAFGKIKGYGEKTLAYGKRGALGLVKAPVKGAWRKSNIPHIVGGGVDKFKKSKYAGRWMGLDKKHTEEKEAMRTAKWKARWGDAGAMASYQYAKEREAEKKFEESGAFRGGMGNIKSFYREAVSKGDFAGARIAMRRIASEGKVSTSEVEAFKNKIGFSSLKVGSRKRDDIMKFLDEVHQTQSRNDKMADHTFGIGWVKDPTSGKNELQDLNNITIPGVTKEQHFENIADKMRVTDIADKSVTKVLKEADLAAPENKGLLKVFDKAADQTNIKAFTPEGRKEFSNAIEKVLSDPTIVAHGSARSVKYIELLKKIHGKSFDKNTGDVDTSSVANINDTTYNSVIGNINAAVPGSPYTTI